MNSLQTNGYNLIRLLRAIGENMEFEIHGESTYFINFENNLIMKIIYMNRWDKIEYNLTLDENKFNNALEMCQLKNDESEEVLDVTSTLIIVNFDGLRFGIPKSVHATIKKNPKLNQWINLYRIQNNSTPKNIMMNKSDSKTECGIFNPSTNKLRLYN